MPGADVYFTPAYAALFASLDGDRATCALWESSQGRAIFPLQIRPLTRLPFWSPRWLGGLADSPAYDAISPYGYSGPLTDARSPSEASKIIRIFLDALEEELRAERVVSLFVRLHPLSGNSLYFPVDKLSMALRTETVFIDLTEAWYKELASACRYEVRKSERRGVVVETTDNPEDWQAFGRIYRRTMEDRAARRWYVFPQEFFLETRERLDQGVSLVAARQEGELIGGSIFLHSFGRGQYHLSGSLAKGTGLGVSNRLVVEGARLCESRGCATLHLGGGVEPSDGLWKFKASFSPHRAVWDKACLVLDQPAYERLESGRSEYLLRKAISTNDKSRGGFPSYRRGFDTFLRRSEGTTGG
jgi:serine/alanine adding enzyme